LRDRCPGHRHRALVPHWADAGHPGLCLAEGRSSGSYLFRQRDQDLRYKA
jgi:hypothetical protein